jgi:Zn finger protein HypA/HybF involved in hydrogenase expression
VALLIYRGLSGAVEEHKFAGDASLGSREGSDLRLPSELGVLPTHAVISRSAYYQIPVLVDYALEEGSTRINGHTVVFLKALRHQDSIELGRARMQFWEIYSQEVADGAALLGKRCLVCFQTIQVADRVIACPRCDAPHHEECWCFLPHCAYYGCGYPIQEAFRRVLAPELRSEKLEEEAELVKSKTLCRGAQPRDRSPFKEGDVVAYCPGCDTPYHFECWLAFPQCPVCQFDAARLLRGTLDPTPGPDKGNQEGSD